MIDWDAVEWGSVANWVSGIGSFSAASVALYLGSLSRRIELSGYCGHRLLVGGGAPRQELISINVTNMSPRPTKVTNIGFTCGFWRWKKHGIITFARDETSDGIPKSLSDGEQAHWGIKLDETRSWITDLIKKFEMSNFDVRTFRVHIYTSNGGSKTLKPEKPLLDMFESEVAKQRHG